MSTHELLALMTDQDAAGGYKRVRGQVKLEGGKISSCTIRRADVPRWRRLMGAVLAELDEIEREEALPPS